MWSKYPRRRLGPIGKDAATRMRAADDRLASGGERLSASIVIDRKGRVKDDFNPALTARREGDQQMRREIHIAPPAVKPRILTLWRVIDHRHRLDMQDPVQLLGVEGLKQGRFERQNADSIAGGALGEKEHLVPDAQALSNISCWRLASDPLRVIKTVPVARASQPMPGQPATSDFDTKVIRCAAFRTKISSQDE